MNEKIAKIFEEIANMLEILGENTFRIRAYGRASETIRNLKDDLESMYSKADQDIEKIPGIGTDLHAKIIEIIKTGECAMHQSLVEKVGKGVLEILRIRGIGPKKVKLFIDSLGIDSVEKLKKSAQNGELAKLPGMGEKSQQSILESIEENSISKERISYDKAIVIAKNCINYMKKCKSLEHIEYAGSLRREKETIGDIDLLAYGENSTDTLEHFVKYPKIKKILSSGDTKISIVLKDNMQIDLRVVDKEAFGSALMYFTGSKQFNINFRTLALKKGFKVNEYGIFKGENKIAGESEESMFEALGLPYVEPYNREE